MDVLILMTSFDGVLGAKSRFAKQIPPSSGVDVLDNSSRGARRLQAPRHISSVLLVTGGLQGSVRQRDCCSMRTPEKRK